VSISPTDGRHRVARPLLCTVTMRSGITNSSRPLTPCRLCGRLIVAILLTPILASTLFAQSKDWPFSTRTAAGPSSPALGSTSPSIASTPPPLAAPLRQETFAQLSDSEISPTGAQALAIKPRQWYHGETENFVVHYRNFSDALQIAREIEFDLWYVAKALGAGKEQYARKSHVYVFQDEKEWQEFVQQSHSSSWVHSFAQRDDLFLNIHGTGSGFDSHTLAHETTHAVVARIYGSRRWPLWLSEGFAEYMGDASTAARRQQLPSLNSRHLGAADMTLTELFAVSHYPEDIPGVSQLYDTSAKFVGYLFQKYPPALFPKFVDRLLDGASPAVALAEVYGDEFRDLAAFDKRFQTLAR
jgi:hypothetical protein